MCITPAWGGIPSSIARQPRRYQHRTIHTSSESSPRDLSNADLVGTDTTPTTQLWRYRPWKIGPGRFDTHRRIRDPSTGSSLSTEDGNVGTIRYWYLYTNVPFMSYKIPTSLGYHGGLCRVHLSYEYHTHPWVLSIGDRWVAKKLKRSPLKSTKTFFVPYHMIAENRKFRGT